MSCRASKRAPKASADAREIILLGIVGMSPAVITETVWALAFPPRGAEPIIPHRVRLITTTEGLKHIEKLRGATPQFGGRPPWEAMRAAIVKKHPEAADRLHLENPRILSTRSQRGIDVELPDIRTPAENEAAADFILDAVREIANRSDQRLVATLAGGRKTMGALLYAAMNLVAREDDVLTHVLVKDPFDAPLTPPFWFPGEKPTRHELRDRDGKLVREVSSADAGIELARVPFVPLRNRFRELPEHASEGSFMHLVRRISRDLVPEPVGIEFPAAGRILKINGREVRMEKDSQVTILHWLCSVQGEPWLDSDFATARVFFKAAHGVSPVEGTLERRWYQHAVALREKNKGKTLPPDLTDDDALAKAFTRALNELRRRSSRAGVEWAPPQRSLKLPPFVIVK